MEHKGKINRIAGAFIRTNESTSSNEVGIKKYNALRQTYGLQKNWLRIALKNAPIKMYQNEIARRMGYHESLISYVLDGKRMRLSVRVERFIKRLYDVV